MAPRYRTSDPVLQRQWPRFALARFLLMVTHAMPTKSEVPWVYLCLKVQYAWPQAGARLALGLPHAWPANGRDEPRVPVGPGGLVLATLESAVGGLP